MSDLAAKRLDDHDTLITTLLIRITAMEKQLAKATGHMPRPTPKFWALSEEERQAELHKLTGFVNEILKPQFGHMVKLGDCWPEHPVCLVAIDIMAELWKYLFLSERRTVPILTGQSEFLLRHLPGLLAIAAKETATCPHMVQVDYPRAAS